MIEMAEPRTMNSQSELPTSAADSDPLIGLLSQLGLPLTKANYLLILTHPDVPTFPLDAELAAMVPDEIPGPMPTSVEEM
jgi:hypothetical protein